MSESRWRRPSETPCAAAALYNGAMVSAQQVVGAGFVTAMSDDTELVGSFNPLVALSLLWPY